MRILHIEDNPADAEMVGRVLRRAGLTPTTQVVDNLADFQAALGQPPLPDIILSDYHFLGHTALDVLAWLKTQRCGVPVIVITGTVSEDIVVNCLRLGAVDYFLKDRLQRLPLAIAHAIQHYHTVAELAEAQRQQALLMENAPVVLYTSNTIGEVQFINSAMPDLFGYPIEAFRRNPYLMPNIIHPQDQADTLLAIAEALEKQTPLDVEYRVVTASGGLGWAHVRAVYRDALWYSVLLDITARKQTEADLRATTELLHTAYAAMPVMMGVAELRDDQVMFLEMNPYGCDVLQIARSTLPCNLADTNLDTATTAAGVASFRRVAITGQAWHSERLFTFKDGSQRWMAGSIVLLTQQANAIYPRVALYAFDMTERKRMELAAFDREQRFRSLLESQTHFVVRTDIEGRYTYVNPHFLQHFGYQESFILGRPYMETVHPEDVPMCQQAAMQCLTNPDQVVPLTIRKPRANAQFYWSQWEFVAIQDDAGLVTEIQAVGHDVTNQREAERALKRQLKESETLANISWALNQTLDLGLTMNMIVESVQTLLPKAAHVVLHLLDDDLRTLVPQAAFGYTGQRLPSLAFKLGEGIAGQAVAEGQVINVRDITTHPRLIMYPGQCPVMRSLLVAPVSNQGRWVGALSVDNPEPAAFTKEDERTLRLLVVHAGLALDKARLFEMERRRTQSADSMRRVTATLIRPLIGEDVAQHALEALMQMSRYSHVALYWLNESDLNLCAEAPPGLFPPTLASHSSSTVWACLHNTQSRLVTNPAQLRTLGWPTTARTVALIPMQAAGRTSAVLVVEPAPEHTLDPDDVAWLENVAHQIAVGLENRRLYFDLEKAYAQEQVMRNQIIQSEKLSAIGRMIASVAHEINNPLQVMQRALTFVQAEPNLPAHVQEDIAVMLAETDRMAALIRQLRNVYRPTHETQANTVPVDVLAQLHEVHNLIAHHAERNQSRLVFHLPPSLPQVPAIADHLKQVWLNLCLNGIEAMPNGGELAVSAWAEPGPTGQAGVRVSIHDTGPGIEASTLTHIFEPFFTTKEQGAGLGLAIAHSIITRHHGDISAHSEPGEGTTFEVWLPTLASPTEPV